MHRENGGGVGEGGGRILDVFFFYLEIMVLLCFGKRKCSMQVL